MMKDSTFHVILMDNSLLKRSRRYKHKTHLAKHLSRTHTVPWKREKRQVSCVISLFDLSTWGQTHNFKEEENYQDGVYLMKSDFEWHQYAAKEWLGREKQRCLNKACDDCENTEPTTGFWVWPDGPKHALTVLGMLCGMGSSKCLTAPSRTTSLSPLKGNHLVKSKSLSQSGTNQSTQTCSHDAAFCVIGVTASAYGLNTIIRCLWAGDKNLWQHWHVNAC